MTGILAFLLIAAQAPVPVIRNYDPPGAEEWEQTVTFRCGATSLRVSGYGVVKPRTRPAALTVNGVPLRGAAAEALRRDLSIGAAVYRLAARCPKDRHSIALIVTTGESLETGEIIYRVGRAMIRRGQLQSYAGLKPANAETFWFR